jgi:UPF0755 protein
MKRLLPPLLALLIVASATLAGAWRQYSQFLETPLTATAETVIVDIRPGESVRAVLRQLEQRGVLDYGWKWRLLSRLETPTFNAGEFELPPGLKPPALFNILSGIQVRQYRFTIVEGWTFRQLLAALASDDNLEAEAATHTEPLSLLTAAGVNGEHAEGWFLPETYQYVRGDSDLDILRRAHQAMQESLQAAWQSRYDNLPLETPYELLTLASIVEKETSKAGERAAVAGVFVRRLQQRWRLETDPTVIYGLGENWDGDLRKRDLRTDTPYNTYTRYGLPPTPIALPGKAALQAVAHPAPGDAMFFVADGKGGHTFSATLEEHNRAVRKLIGKRP